MIGSARQRTGSFHAGELAVQERAGVRDEAARLSGMLAPACFGTGAASFLAGRTFAALTARDGSGRLWISPLTGAGGFLDVTSSTELTVHAVPVPGDPLHAVEAGQQVGLIAVEFAARRRFRVNGTLTSAGAGTLRIEAEQAYGNCPRYIQRRLPHPAPAGTAEPEPVRRGGVLAAEDRALVRFSDTFLVGTAPYALGGDASHRGGSPGFVRVVDDGLWWPEYDGNNMFNTLGNLAADPHAALLFCEFATGRTLHLSGTAEIDWTAYGVPGDDDSTGRRVRFTPEERVAGRLLPLRAAGVVPAPENPPLTDGGGPGRPRG